MSTPFPDTVPSSVVFALNNITIEINKLTQEIIKLNERLEDATTCARGGKT